jgi:hypothetical protein
MLSSWLRELRQFRNWCCWLFHCCLYIQLKRRMKGRWNLSDIGIANKSNKTNWFSCWICSRLAQQMAFRLLRENWLTSDAHVSGGHICLNHLPLSQDLRTKGILKASRFAIFGETTSLGPVRPCRERASLIMSSQGWIQGTTNFQRR